MFVMVGRIFLSPDLLEEPMSTLILKRAAANRGLGQWSDNDYVTEPAHAARNNAWATARAIFRANMNEARFWIGVADQFAAAGNETSANQASNEANFFLGQAEGAMNDMSNAC
jgi:hypothetical protein